MEGQKYAPRLECLLRVPAKVRFVSAEPLLGPLDLKPYFYKCTGCVPTPEDPRCACKGLAIHQIIVGGESGPGARPMHPDWPRSLRDQCQAAGVPFFFKQWGQWGCFQDNGPLPPNCRYIGLDGVIRIGDSEDDTDACMGRVGKKSAGALLDGREWREMPAGGGS